MKNKEIKVIEVNEPLLSKTEMHLLACAMYGSIKEYYKDPANMEKFEKWKAEREKDSSI